MSGSGSFDVTRFHERRRALGASLGEPLVTAAVTQSTNDDALRAAQSGEPHGTTFVADAQERGRGRRGHTWTSPPGENLTCSMLLRPKIRVDRVHTLTLLVGLAVRAVAARRVTEPVTVKWPNDVVAGRRKLAGILVESRVSGGALDAVVVGVGLNVHMRELPADIAAIATSLALLGDARPSREDVLAELLAEMELRLRAFLHGGLAVLVPELRDHDALAGEPVSVGEIRGVGAGIDEDGALLLRTASGDVERVLSGTVVRG